MRRNIEHWRENDVQREGPVASERRTDAPSAAPMEPHVPRVVCRDGKVAPDCPVGSPLERCCTNQGGVYRDAWGNVVVRP